jgi:hypothetical protein
LDFSATQRTTMSALLPKADMCDATRDVRFGPIADMSCNGTPAPGLEKNAKHLSAFGLGKIRRRKGSVWYFASGSGFGFCGPARNGGDKAVTAVLHIHDIFLTDVPKCNT